MRRNNHPKNRKILSKCKLEYLIFAFLFLVFFYIPAFAHKVMIFAWVEGDTVYTQSKFSGGKRTKNAEVIVFDTKDNQLLEGKTDENGEFSFKIPGKTGLKIVLEASMGHRAEWKIPVEEITTGTVSERGPPETDVKAAAETSLDGADVKTKSEPSVSTTVPLGSQEIQTLIDESLDRKLAPIINVLGSFQNQGPGMTEIIAGIGYIFGLVGVALYFANRRKKE